MFDSSGVQHRHPMTCVVPQGSVLGRYSSRCSIQRFRLDLPPGVSVVGYADNVVVMATAHNTSLVKDTLNSALEWVAG